MANIEIIGLENTGGGNGQLRSARPGTDTYAMPGLTGYVKANGTSAVTASSTIPVADVTGAVASVASADGSIAVTGTTNIDLSVVSTNNVTCQVRNATGATLTKGTVVYITGATGQIPTVSKAQANSDATSAQTLGVLNADLANNTNGYATIIGLVQGTGAAPLDTSAYTDGQQLYLSGTTAGAMTATKPKAPTHLVYVAVVEYAHVTLGKLFVKVQNGYELDEIHDVQINSPANGQTIVYDATNSLWKNANITAGTGISVTNGAGTISIANTIDLASPGAIGGTTPAAGTFTQLTVNGSNVNTSISPTGTGTVTISPVGALTINPTAASTINNASIGATTASTGRFTSVETTTSGVGAGTTPVSSAWVKTAAGTSSISPVLFTANSSGSYATAAGSVDYDGKVQYFTGEASQRGLVQAPMYIKQNAQYSGISTTGGSLTKIFNASTNGAITLTAGTYSLECLFMVSGMGTGTTASNLGFGLTLGGGAVIANVLFMCMGAKFATPLSSTGSGNARANISTGAALNYFATNADTGPYGIGRIYGTFQVTTGGTIAPSFATSATIATTVAIEAGSYCTITPISSTSTGTNLFVGNWS